VPNHRRTASHRPEAAMKHAVADEARSSSGAGQRSCGADFGDANPIRTPESPKARHGLRASEVCDLRWDQVDFNGAVLQVRRVTTASQARMPSRATKCEPWL
jgi:hypothetical protein